MAWQSIDLNNFHLYRRATNEIRLLTCLFAFLLFIQFFAAYTCIKFIRPICALDLNPLRTKRHEFEFESKTEPPHTEDDGEVEEEEKAPNQTNHSDMFVKFKQIDWRWNVYARARTHTHRINMLIKYLEDNLTEARWICVCFKYIYYTHIRRLAYGNLA